MKIVHVNYSDSQGGAAIAVKRIHDLMLKNNINSNVVVSERILDNDKIFSNNKNSKGIDSTFRKALSRQLKYIFKTNNKFTHSLNLVPSNLINLINSLNPDYVNLHWIGNETISISNIENLKAKIIWTLHDMWPFCGAEHYAINERFVNGYNKNNRPDDEKGIDVNRYIWKKKLKHFKKIEKIICTSKWMYDNAKKSYLFKNKNITEIPLAIDSNFWKPLSKKKSKNFFGIEENTKIILYGAENFLKNKRKGFNLFKETLKKYQDNFNSKFAIMLFGDEKHKLNDIENEFGKIKFVKLGRITDEYRMKMIYSSADVVVIPSIVESFGLVALEAIHCNTPCVVFDNTGLTSIIDHKENGYVAKYNSIDDLYNGITWTLENFNNKNELIYKHALQKFNHQKIIQDYLNFIKK